jgi:hypothetical protein
MTVKPGKKKKEKRVQEPHESIGLWVDAALIARLHGRQSATMNKLPIDSECERLLHYADVALGTDKKEKFVSSRPTKHRRYL